MSAYRVVEDFERELCRYTGAPYAVTVNSCSAALLLCLSWWKHSAVVPECAEPVVGLPKRTYASVPCSAKLAGFKIEWRDEDWRGAYQLTWTPIFDCARRFTSSMYGAGYQCVSFQTSKILGLEQGGAILHSDPKADIWLRRARFDGRLNADEKIPQMVGHHCYLNPSTAALGLQRLACLPLHNPDQAGAADFPDLSELPCFR